MTLKKLNQVRKKFEEIMRLLEDESLDQNQFSELRVRLEVLQFKSIIKAFQKYNRKQVGMDD